MLKFPRSPLAKMPERTGDCGTLTVARMCAWVAMDILYMFAPHNSSSKQAGRRGASKLVLSFAELRVTILDLNASPVPVCKIRLRTCVCVWMRCYGADGAGGLGWVVMMSKTMRGCVILASSTLT